MGRFIQGLLCAVFMMTMTLGMTGCGGASPAKKVTLSEEEEQRIRDIGKQIREHEAKNK